jgi:hypothetical protein
VFDLGDDELLDRIEADGAEPDRVERSRGDERLLSISLLPVCE